MFIYLCLFISDNIHSLWGVSHIIICNDRLWFLIGTLQLIIKSTPTQQPPKEKLTRSLSQWVTELWVWPISCRENDNKIDDIFLCWFLFSDFLRWNPKMVFCYQNCSDLLWEKIVLVIEKKIWNSRLKAKNFQKIWDP